MPSLFREALLTHIIFAASLCCGARVTMTEQCEATSPSSSKSMPVLYVSHGGGPCFFMKHEPGSMWDGMDEESEVTRRYRTFRKEVLENLGGMKSTPRAIVLISAHWEEENPTVLASEDPGLLYDYYGFPEYTYAPHLTYPVKGEPQLATRVVSLLDAAGLKPQIKTDRGFDHGVFIPLKLMFPEADIPVVQVSLTRDLDPGRHIDLGQSLAPLRQEGVLIVGSGSLTHNMRAGVGGSTPKWASSFVDWVDQAVAGSPSPSDAAAQRSGCLDVLRAWASAPGARLAHPREEHFLPLVVAAAAADGMGPATRLFEDTWFGGSFSLGGYLWKASSP